MFELYGCYFYYAGFDSEAYDLVFANVETSRIVSLEAARNVNTIRSKRNHTHLITSITYEDAPISFEAEIVTSDGSPLPDEIVPYVERELFSRTEYGELFNISEYGKSQVYINCVLTNPEKIESEAGIIGFKCVVTTDSSMAWEETTTVTPTMSGSSSKTFSVDVDTDMPGYTYPKVTFTIGSSGGDVTLYNNTDDATRFTSFTGLAPNSTFVMDSRINYISGNQYARFSDRNFIRLKDGTNNFFLTGDVTSITFEFNNRKYI